MSEAHIAPLPNQEMNVSFWDGELTDRELKFCLAYVGECRFNATQAAIVAGFPKRSASERGYEVKNRQHVRARIRAYLANEGLSDEEWLHHVTDVARRALEDYVYINRYDADGNPVGAVMDANAKMKALELYGKARGLFTEKVDVNVKSVHIELNGVDLERLGDGVIDAEGHEVGNE